MLTVYSTRTHTHTTSQQVVLLCGEVIKVLLQHGSPNPAGTQCQTPQWDTNTFCTKDQGGKGSSESDELLLVLMADW